MRNLDLKELVWEITLRCDKKCAYCGSKGVLNSVKWELPDAKKVDLANRIADYPPEEVVLSGGEPGMVPQHVLHDVLGILQGGGSKVKAVTNGKLIEEMGDAIGDFDRIGWSINTVKDANAVEDSGATEEAVFGMTMISNFGKHNLWDFGAISARAAHFGIWQVQLTEGEDLLPPEGIKMLRGMIDDSHVKSKIVLGDNLRGSHECTAGFHSCGVLANGLVVPCLSMRSWADDEYMSRYSKSMFEHPLREIWQKDMSEWRFDKFRKCCFSKIKFPPQEVRWSKTTEIHPLPEVPDDDVFGRRLVYGVPTPIEPYHPPHDFGPIVTMYAVYGGGSRTSDTGVVCTNNTCAGPDKAV